MSARIKKFGPAVLHKTRPDTALNSVGFCGAFFVQVAPNDFSNTPRGDHSICNFGYDREDIQVAAIVAHGPGSDSSMCSLPWRQASTHHDPHKELAKREDIREHSRREGERG